MGSEPISVVINTLNEERNLPNALASVRAWAAEIVVVDMYSDDRTREIAEAAGARVLLHERLPMVVPARKMAIEAARHEWVFLLDADEMVPKPLSHRVEQIAASQGADVVRVPRQNYIWGKSMRGTGWAPTQDYQIRFFRKDAVEVGGQIHRDLVVSPGSRVIDLPEEPGIALIHFNYVTVSDFLRRLDRYTTAEATAAMAEGEEYSTKRSVRHAMKEFRRRYFRDGGKREGWHGLYLSLFMAFYRLAIHVKIREAKELGGEEGIRRRYQAEADKLLADYDKASNSR